MNHKFCRLPSTKRSLPSVCSQEAIGRHQARNTWGNCQTPGVSRSCARRNSLKIEALRVVRGLRVGNLVALGGGQRGAHAAGDRPRRVDLAGAEVFDDFLAKLA